MRKLSSRACSESLAARAVPNVGCEQRLNVEAELVESPEAPRVFASNLSSSLDEALSVLFTLGTGALHARRCSLYLRSGEEANLALYHATGMPISASPQRVAVQGTIMGMVARSRVPLLVE